MKQQREDKTKIADLGRTLKRVETSLAKANKEVEANKKKLKANQGSPARKSTESRAQLDKGT